jgi:hypothetical protein
VVVVDVVDAPAARAEPSPDWLPIAYAPDASTTAPASAAVVFFVPFVMQRSVHGATKNDVRTAAPSPPSGGVMRGPMENVAHDYAHGHQRPLGGYAVLTGAFFAAFGGALGAARASGKELDRPGLADVALTALATQKVSRLISKDKVTSFVRAPFTRFQDTAGHGELEEEARGDGLRFATGELLLCPYCISQWVVGGLAVGWVAAPRTTRLLTAMWAAQAVADGLQVAYSAAETKT